jgi:CubicO group peptidase (beta-lactamase class C family)
MPTSINRNFDNYVKKHYTENPTPNLVAALVNQNSVLHHVAFNLPQNKMTTNPLTTQFRIASMTKPFTALSLLQLRDSGKLTLDHKIKYYLPWLNENWDGITIKHALTMRSGFSKDDPWADRTLNHSNQEIESRFNQFRPIYKPDIHYQYNNLGYMILGKIISQVSGLSLEEYMKSHIFKPLGMKNTGFNFSKNCSSVKGYQKQGSVHPDAFVESTYFNIHNDYAGFGGLCSTIEDLQKFIGFYLNKDNQTFSEVLSLQSRREAQRFSQVNSLYDYRQENAGVLPESYGYGLRNFAYNGEIFSGHAGGIPGFNSFMLWSQKYNIGIIALNNCTGPNVWLMCLNWMKSYSLAMTRYNTLSNIDQAIHKRGEQILKLIKHWDKDLTNLMFAENMFLDYDMDTLKQGLASILDSTKLSIVWDRHLNGIIVQNSTSTPIITFTLSPLGDNKIQSLELLG